VGKSSSPPSVREILRARPARVFLDLKFHDIPRTVEGAVRPRRARVAIVDVHASGGKAMMTAAVAAAREAGRGARARGARCHRSHPPDRRGPRGPGLSGKSREQVLRLARLAAERARWVVASALE
jgi:orotidine-5'-phosphate decarboxylase